MFIVEFKGKKLLFTGDGLGKDLVEYYQKNICSIQKAEYMLIS